ncbi:MAG: ATP-binding cassette domain-containing protein [Candidatus Cloacimonetes bacterium]|jgi:ATP-binding cassette subfamily F protein 3|nr:ATP-binding cassette domain-containing protein [Candidatus Cloacimonadota bacterium]MDD3143119.1 ABC-F family ATP-binding cassette domain-containing protein [Candidatus Cloacimonadota bacterium]MDY0366687.1 ABC-F family ATP-binding cassette domain-containing protein [Candidatus Syntrophosphaera sp.]HOY84692.1 ABC-F family ATP-binding cassette domain-containing protein [Candidatus Syntrophosphaera sp.]HPH60301.1 ABC-F family ATP-binding cassette domain-containing protein [Candidatus Syntropho
MQFIQLNTIHYTYPDQYQPVLAGVSLVVAEGEKIALIGKNGCGKTTLLRIILGELSPTRGRISYPTSRPTISYLPQDIRVSAPLSVRDFLLQVRPRQFEMLTRIDTLSSAENLSPSAGIELASLWQEYNDQNTADWENEVHSILLELDLLPLAEQRCATLSGGESTRLQLAALLLEKPDILILDEPTNHLDSEQLLWFEDWMLDYGGAVLFVSHDRVFIDHTATKIAELEAGQLELRAGNYQSFVRDRQQLKDHQMVQYRERQRLLRQLCEASRKRRAWASSFQKETRGEGGGHVFELITNPARTQMQQARNIENRIKMLTERYPVEKPHQDKLRHLAFEQVQVADRELINVAGMGFRYQESWIFRDFYLHLNGAEKLWLAGPNGSGKTTLLRLLQGSLDPCEGSISRANRLRIGCFEQDLSRFDPHALVLDFLKASGKEESQIRTLMGCIGLKTDLAFARTGSLSWGERAKLQLLRLLLAEYNVLLLDEPTNHLDIRSREMLEESLDNFTGAMVFVSHDRAFISRLATRKVELSEAPGLRS